MDEWLAPRCPGCNELPMLTFGGRQAFCGNEDCRVVTWDRGDDPAKFKAKAVVMEFPDLPES